MSDIDKHIQDLASGEFAKRQAAKLEKLAGEINEEHRQCEAAFTSGLQHAIRAGELLEDAKSTLGHGNWLDWLKKNFDGSVRTAQAYMRVARKREDFETLEGFDEEGKAKRVAHLSLRDTLKALAEPTTKEMVEDVRREGRKQRAEDQPGEGIKVVKVKAEGPIFHAGSGRPMRRIEVR